MNEIEQKEIFDKYGNYNFPTDIKQDSPNTATTQIEEMASIMGECKKTCTECYAE